MLADISESAWRWHHFSHKEMACKGTGECRMSPEFMDTLEVIREEYGKPLTVTSGYRSPKYNTQVSTTGETGPHVQGQAVDIQIRGSDAFKLIQIALSHGITGLGVSQKGLSRFIHLDCLKPPDFPRPTCWSY
jgi:uncharacterized protein YcbK (DUF882 family)